MADSAILNPHAATRLSWAPPASSLQFEAVWWPRSRDAVAELRMLLPSVHLHSGRIVRRVSINPNTWRGDHPDWIPVEYHVVQVGWLATTDPNVVTVGAARGGDLKVLVIPPETSVEAAERVVQRITGPVTWTRNARSALSGTSTIAAVAE
jgi:hypothetical protein